MMTLRQLSTQPPTIPSLTAWYLADLGEARGKQELFTRQSPQKLKVLRQHALIESAVSSNRIEGVEIDPLRIGTVVFGKSLLHDRPEEEVRGYRNALQLVHEQAARLSVSDQTIRRLHRLSRGDIWDAGKLKAKTEPIIEKYPDGRVRIRFTPVEAGKERQFLKDTFVLWRDCLREQWVHPLIALAATNLDFLCIHPFRDGNGRASRLLLLLQSYHLGYEVGRYVSVERLIEENKDRYYETLEQGSHGWHQGKHDPWPFINYLLFILKTAYQEFEQRVGQITSPRGEKTAMIFAAIDRQIVPFRVADLQRECPGVSVDMIRHVLDQLRLKKRVKCLGLGRSAKWEKVGN